MRQGAIPPYKTPDFERLVAGPLNEAMSGYPYLSLPTAPTGIKASFSYYDTTLSKVRTWDGSAWNNHF